jgi:hypothetical protein
MPALALVVEQALEQVLVLAQVRVLGRVRVLVQVLVQAVLAWVPVQEQARVKGVSGPVVLRDRTAMDLGMEAAMAVLVRQTVRALVPVRVGMVPAPEASNARLCCIL